MKKIPIKEALQARLQELGLLFYRDETNHSMWRRVARFSIKEKPQFYIPEKAGETPCFGFFYDEVANECLSSGICEISEDCFMFTRSKMEESVMNKGPKKRRIR